jgi:hypothetical protein
LPRISKSIRTYTKVKCFYSVEAIDTFAESVEISQIFRQIAK